MASHLRIASLLTKLLENQFRFLNFRFGLDPLLGLIPGLGDVVALGLSLYIVWIGYTMKLPQRVLFLMLGNIILDFVIGIVPFLGDIGDFVFKANTRNLVLLQKYASAEVLEGEIITLR